MILLSIKGCIIFVLWSALINPMKRTLVYPKKISNRKQKLFECSVNNSFRMGFRLWQLSKEVTKPATMPSNFFNSTSHLTHNPSANFAQSTCRKNLPTCLTSSPAFSSKQKKSWRKSLISRESWRKNRTLDFAGNTSRKPWAWCITQGHPRHQKRL